MEIKRTKESGAKIEKEPIGLIIFILCMIAVRPK